MNSIRSDGQDALRSGEVAPFDAVVKVKGEEIAWPAGRDRVVIGAVARAEVNLVLVSDESELTNYAWYSGNNSPSATKDVGKKLIKTMQKENFSLISKASTTISDCTHT